MVKQINEPRRAQRRSRRRKEITVWDAACINAEVCRCGFDGSPTRVVRTFAPTRNIKGEKFEGEPREVATAVVERLIAEKII